MINKISDLNTFTNMLSSKLNGHVNMTDLISTIESMSAKEVQDLMIFLIKSSKKTDVKNQTESSSINDVTSYSDDFLEIESLLTKNECKKLNQFRSFLKNEVRPVMKEYWDKGETPKFLFKKYSEFRKKTMPVLDHNSALFNGILNMESNRVDASFSTFIGVHHGLFLGTLLMAGSENQKEKWLQKIIMSEKIGAWSLTEPNHGSDTKLGLETTAMKKGSKWIINGEKKWAGNTPFCDVTCVFAKDVTDQNVKAFLIEKGTPGLSVEKITGKISLRAVENGLMRLENCEICESNRLPGINSFFNVSEFLGFARYNVAWSAVGTALGCYDACLNYTKKRHQFGKPIASYQLIQQYLVKMLSNISAMQSLLIRLATIEDSGGKVSGTQAAIAKLFCTEKCREVVAYGRSAMGGNGILLEYESGKHFCDAESHLSYEGSYEMNLLLAGKKITGISAFL